VGTYLATWNDLFVLTICLSASAITYGWHRVERVVTTGREPVPGWNAFHRTSQLSRSRVGRAL